MQELSFGVLIHQVVCLLRVASLLPTHNVLTTNPLLSSNRSVDRTKNINATETRSKRIVDPQFNLGNPLNSPVMAPRDALSDYRQGTVGPEINPNLLDVLEHRIQERNMLLRQSNLMRENELLREKEQQLFQRPFLRENNLLRQKPSIYNSGLFSRPREHLLMDNQLPVHDEHELNPEEESLLSQDLTNVGNLGDETMPYGSLGELRSNYIPLGRFSDQLLPSEEMTDVIPATPHHRKPKKTWVTDVNVYSKKKKMDDDINDLLGADDNDPLDEYDPCESNKCHNGGLCKVAGNTEFICICPRTFKGTHCEIRNHCHPNPCGHGSTCTQTTTGFKCTCTIGFKGTRCNDRNFCLPNPCENDGVCTQSLLANEFSCMCKEEWFGRSCNQKKSPCLPNPCQHQGRCVSNGATFECICEAGIKGRLCEESSDESNLEAIANLLHVDRQSTSSLPHLEHSAADENAISKSVIASSPVSVKFPCAINPCLHGGVCITDSSQPLGHRCDCPSSYSGVLCSERKCKCENEGVCVGEGWEQKCVCKPGYGGTTCAEHIQCNDNTCMHGGICIEQVGGYKCKCDNGYKGKRCTEIDKCKPNPCLHDGLCTGVGDIYQCECKHGFKGNQCEEIDLCAPSPCHNDGQCFAYPGGYQCECLPGYRGKTCDQKVHCLSTPCSNGAECIEQLPTPEYPEGSYKCGCKSGFMGSTCEDQDFCHNSPCHHDGTCTNFRDGFMCSCSPKYHGELCQNINHCYGTPCKNNGKCISGAHEFKCDCSPGYRGILCQDVDYCEPNPCKNNGYCTTNNQRSGFVCHCAEGFRGLTCSDVDPCFPNPCSHGQCEKSTSGFVCNCTKGFKGPKCTEIERCNPNPCFHNGACSEINGGSDFLCQCTKGYRGDYCEKKDLCNPNPCNHNGICRGALGKEKYISPNVDDFKCACAKGFRGKRCNEYDPCFPNPCFHDSKCLSEETSHATSCNCTVGWKGEQCQLLDLCSPNPCRYGTHCIQTDKESYQCVKNMCQPTPCKNGGKCILVDNEQVECACSSGWSGKYCEKRNVCSSKPCLNGGICQQNYGGSFTCKCSLPYSGAICSTRDYCAGSPCKNGGTCMNKDDRMYCRCPDGFQGTLCEESVCNPSPCSNGGTCIPYYGIALCQCVSEYTGAHCSSLKDTGKPKFSKTWQDTRAVTKSFTPHANDSIHLSHASMASSNALSDKPLTMKDVSSPAFIEKVVEILNGENDKTEIIQSVPVTPQKQIIPEAIQQQASSSTLSRNVIGNPPNQNVLGNPSNQNVLGNPPNQNVLGNPPNQNVLGNPPNQNAQPSQQNQPLQLAISKTPMNTGACSLNTCKNQATCVTRNNGEAECICPSGFSGPYCADIGNMGYSSAPKFFPQDECNHCDMNAICVNGHCICEQGYVGDGLECWVKTIEDAQWSCEVNPCQNGGTCKRGRAQCVCRLGYVGKYCEKYCPPAVHLSFDSAKNGVVIDESGNGNHAMLKNGAVVVNQQGKCDSAVALQGGDVLFNGLMFKPKPREGITIALWIKVDTIYGSQSIFDTIGGRMSNHTDGQYHLEIDNGKIRWFHRNEIHATIFDVRAERLIQVNRWTHVVGVYDGFKRLAKLFLDGDTVGEYRNTGAYWQLSQDWERKAGLGKHLHPFGNRLLRGMVDEFFIFECALPRLEILVLMHHCKLYFKHDKKSEKPSTQSPNHQPAGLTSNNIYNQLSISNPIVNTSSVNSLLQSSFPAKTSNTLQNFLRFDVKESSYGPDIKEPFPGSFPPNRLQLMKNQPAAARKSQVPAFPWNRFQSEVFGPSAINMRQLQSNAKRVNIFKPSTNIPTINYFNIPSAVRSPSSPMANRNSILRSQPQLQRASGRQEHITGPSALFSQFPSTMKSYMGIKTTNTHPMFPTKATSPVLQQYLASLPAYNDRRWFSWTQGLAQTSGKTHTNTHSNSLQKNDPGTVATDTHVVSSQGSQSDTNVKQMYPFASSAYTYRSEEEKRLAILRNLHLLQQENPHTRQTHTQGHNHQWGYGNGNGKGHGVGTPGASGSGGGWGTGGPLSQSMSLPAWNGDKPPQPNDSQAEPAQQRDGFIRTLQNIAMHSTAPATMQIWNSYLSAAAAANKRQSQSNALADTDNTASSGVSITPTNGNQVTGSNHHWGFGNGNGDGHGTGAPGGDGSGGGWGTGGPTQTKLQVHDPNQGNIVNPWTRQTPFMHVEVPQNVRVAYRKSAVSLSPFLRYIQNTLPYDSVDFNPRVVRKAPQSLNANFMAPYKPSYVDYTSQLYLPERRKLSRTKRYIRVNPLKFRRKKIQRR